jgi:hypothetical protein
METLLTRVHKNGGTGPVPTSKPCLIFLTLSEPAGFLTVGTDLPTVLLTLLPTASVNIFLILKTAENSFNSDQTAGAEFTFLACT